MGLIALWHRGWFLPSLSYGITALLLTSAIAIAGSLILRGLEPSKAEIIESYCGTEYNYWRWTSRLLLLFALANAALAILLNIPLLLITTAPIVAFACWLRVLPQRIVITKDAQWQLGFPVQAALHAQQLHSDSEHSPQSDLPTAADGIKLKRSKWRWYLGFGLWVAWSYWLWSSGYFYPPRFSSLISLQTISLWLMGGICVFLVSRLPVHWFPPRGSQVLWQQKTPALRIFYLSALPSCLIAAFVSMWGLLEQMIWTAPLVFSASTTFNDLFILSIALIFLADPSSIHSWVAAQGKTLYIRRCGWVECHQIPLPQN